MNRLRTAPRIRQSYAMEEAAVRVRAAKADDADAVARVYITSWHDTYPAILPLDLLRAMSPRGQTARWRAAIAAGGRERVLVAETSKHGIVGMTSFGPALDRELSYDGEIYTLYVAPDHMGQGVGSALLRGAFGVLGGLNCSSCVIWAHARNSARYFYEAMGGRIVAERSRPMAGASVPELGFGWTNLSLAIPKKESGGKLTRS